MKTVSTTIQGTVQQQQLHQQDGHFIHPPSSSSFTEPSSTRTGSVALQDDLSDPTDPYLHSNPTESQKNNNKLYKPHVQSGLFGASSNLVNAIVGAGIIGIPYALKQSGIIAGVILLILVIILTEKSLRLIVGLASFHPTLRRYHVRTFEDLASYPFDRIGRIFILTNMFILAYGAMLAYLLIIKDTVPTILRFSVSHLNTNATLSTTTNTSTSTANSSSDNQDWWYANTVLIVSSLVIILPLAIKRDMASLAIFSSFSVSADVVLTIFILIYAPIYTSIQHSGGLSHVLIHNAIQPSTLFIAVGILSTAMSCQHSCFIISESLRDKTQRRWAMVTGSSLFFAGFFTATLGIAGYLGFLQDTKGDVLNNFDSKSYEANFARLLLAITMFFTYPMESFVARHVLVVLFHGGDIDGVVHQEEDISTVNSNITATTPREQLICLCLNRRHILSMGIFFATLLPAIILSDIGPVLSITGSLGGAFLCYFSPGMVYLGVYGEEFLQSTEQLLDSYHGGKLFKRKQQKNKSNSHVTKDDLPMDGTANVWLNTHDHQNPSSSIELPIAGDSSQVLVTFPKATQSKPIWWYIGLFPFWCFIARVGKSNMNKKCSSAATLSQSSDILGDISKPPTCCDFLYAMVFITFGIISAVAGVVSNIWFLLKK